MEEQKLLKRKRKAVADGNESLFISTCINLAERYVAESRYLQAVDEYKLVAKKYQETNQSIDYGRANRMIGEAYIQLREYNKALKHLQVHLEVAKAENDKLEEQRALATIGHIYLTSYLDVADNPDKNALNLAYRSFMKSLVVCESLTGVSKRERMDMSARLFANVGVVQECLGDYDKGIELIQKCIGICKSHDIFEQLERGYVVLGSLYTKKGDYSNGIHHYNLAVDVASRLDDKAVLMSSSLLAKAEILIVLSDFHGAKSVLLKAYKLGTTNKIERESIERKLKVVAAMCYTEDSLLTTGVDDSKTKMKLYEKMGDGACALKNLPKAIEYYKKMLEAALGVGEAERNLCPCYESLAQTYMDNKQYDLSVEYFKKDYALHANDLKESVNTLFSIAEAMDAAGADFTQVRAIYEEAKNKCKEFDDSHMEGKVLTRCVKYVTKCNDPVGEIDGLERVLSELDYATSDGESLDSITSDIGADVYIEDITDVSDGSDGERDLSRPRGARNSNKRLVIKRNNKGETQLHTACIAGNAALVRRLLDQGHVVNVRDNCGWLPIHEACICGHVEIINMLLDKGAAINDRGGNLCNGMTPLHDASSNGHLEVIRLLLDKGASPISKTNDGETPLHILKRWHETVRLDPDEETTYDSIVERMSQALVKSGHDKDPVSTKTHSALVQDDDVRITRQPIGPVGNLRRNVDVSDSEEECSNLGMGSEAKDEYQTVMNSLRHGINEGKKRKSSDVVKKPALMQPDDVGDDWLEDDLGSVNKKRRTLKGDVFGNSSNVKSKTLIDDEFESFDVEGIDLDHDVIDISCSSSAGRPKRKSQVSLISAGFTRRCDGTPKDPVSKLPPTNKRKHQMKLTNFAETTTIDLSNSAKMNDQSVLRDPMLSVDVRIDGRLYRVPVPLSQTQSLTIKWLAEEAVKRYCRRECMKPLVELETINGAVLADDDLVSILFPLNSMQSEEVNAKILKWNLPPLLDRYKEACVNMNTDANPTLTKLLQETSTTLDLADLGLRAKSLNPLCKSLNRQNNLHHLNLAGNFISNECMELLCSSLPSLDNLSALNLSLNHLNGDALNHLANVFTQSEKNILENLVSLDVSYNPLGDDSLKHLAVVTRYLKLRVLKLKNVGFTTDIFESFSNRDIELAFDYLEDLDLGANRIDKDQILKFVSWVKPKNVQRLDVSHNGLTQGGLTTELIQLFQADERLNLKSLNVSACMVADFEIYDLLILLSRSERFQLLNLSHNCDLSAVSLRRLLEHSFVELDLVGCENIFRYFGNCSDATWNFRERDGSFTIRSLKLSVDYGQFRNECETLTDMWRNKYEGCVVTKELRNFFQLSVRD